MKAVRVLSVVVAIALAAGVSVYTIDHPGRGSTFASSAAPSLDILSATEATKYVPTAPAAQRYALDATQSKFIAHALAGGLLWFKGHDHLVAVREFTGEAQWNSAALSASSLQINAKTASMVETSSVFTDQQKQIINKELREIVLLPEQYPDIIFKSTNVTGTGTSANQYDLKIAGDLTLHGVTRRIAIPTKVTITGNEMHAVGEFSINRSDFGVKATSAFHGLVRVRDKVKFNFDIVGHPP